MISATLDRGGVDQVGAGVDVGLRGRVGGGVDPGFADVEDAGVGVVAAVEGGAAGERVGDDDVGEVDVAGVRHADRVVERGRGGDVGLVDVLGDRQRRGLGDGGRRVVAGRVGLVGVDGGGVDQIGAGVDVGLGGRVGGGVDPGFADVEDAGVGVVAAVEGGAAGEQIGDDHVGEVDVAGVLDADRVVERGRRGDVGLVDVLGDRQRRGLRDGGRRRVAGSGRSGRCRPSRC